MSSTKRYKPNFHAFVTFTAIIPVAITVILLGLGIVSFLLSYPELGSIVFILGVIVGFFTLIAVVIKYISYQKEYYEIQDGKLVRYYGSLFTDGQIELKVKNITLVENIKPFLRKWMYGVGDIRVEAAGSKESEIYFTSIDDSEEIYTLIRQEMVKHGFDLGTDDLRIETKPHVLGVFINLLSLIGQGLLIVFFMALGALDDFDISTVLPIAVGVILVSIIPAIPLLILAYMDLSQRNYRVYAEIMTYHEGFLTTHDAFIAAQNLADVSTKQNPIQKLFGIYSIGLSTQGVGREMKFTNIIEGKEFEAEIDRIINGEHTQASKPAAKHATAATDNTPVSKVVSKLRRQGDDFSRSIPLSFLKLVTIPTVLSSVLVIPLLIVLAIALHNIVFASPVLFLPILVFIGGFLTHKFTQYEIKRASFSSNFSFLITKKVEFSVDKVTGVIVSRDIIDQIIGTMTVKILSIGTGENIVFANITYDPQLIDQILGKMHIDRHSPDKVTTMRQNFSFSKWLSANLYITLLSIVIGLIFLGAVVFTSSTAGIVAFIIISLILAFVVGVAFVYLKLYYQRSVLTIFEGFVEFTSGIFLKQKYYAEFEDIKDIQTKQYPGFNSGEVKFDIAGDTISMTKQQKKKRGEKAQPVLISNSFTVRYLDTINKVDDIIDSILLYAPKAGTDLDELTKKFSTEVMLTAKPSVAQIVFFPYLVSVVLIPFIPVGVIMEACKSYQIEKNRVVSKWGVIFKYQKSILHTKLDFINRYETFANKVFGTGNIQLNTVGSSKIEMYIDNIPEKNEFYEMLQEVYGKH